MHTSPSAPPHFPAAHSATLEVAGATVTYHCAGSDHPERPVLILVHGTTGSTQSHFGYLFPMLSYEQRVVSVDLAPPAGDAPLTLAQLTAQVSAVIDAVRGTGPVALLGYSLGAVVAASVAAARPEVVQRLVLVAGWMHTDPHQRLRNQIWQTLRRETSNILRHYMVFCAFSRDFLAARSSQEQDEIARRIEITPFADQQMALNASIDIRAEVANIRATTLVIGCSADLMVPRAHSQQLFGAIDDARYTQIDAGHAVVFERPAELLRAIDTFLAAPAAHPPGSRLAALQP